MTTMIGILFLCVLSFLGLAAGVNTTNDPSLRNVHFQEVTVQSNTGVMLSPNYPRYYPDDYMYRYDINVGSQPADVEIEFKYFDLESCSGCSCDYVKIENYRLSAQTFCGSSLPNNNGLVQLSGVDNYVWVTFRSNAAYHRTGFYATYTITPTSSYPQVSTTEMTTQCPPVHCPMCRPNYYPHMYQNGPCRICSCVLGNYYQTTTLPPLSTVCSPIFCSTCSVGSHPHVVYGGTCSYCYCRSDYETTTLQGGGCPPVTCPMCSFGYYNHMVYENGCNVCTCAVRTTTPEWFPFFTTQGYQTTTRTPSETHYLHTSGNFSSPNYPYFYPSFANEQWIVATGYTGLKTLKLTFHGFRFEACDPTTCSCDYLRISGDDFSYSLCDASRVSLGQTYLVNTTSDVITFHLHSDSGVQEQGFSLSYAVVNATGADDTCRRESCYLQCEHYVYDYFGCCTCSTSTTTRPFLPSSPCPTSVCPSYCQFGTTHYYSNGCYHCVCAGATTQHYYQTTAMHRTIYFPSTSGEIESPNYPFSSPNNVQIFNELDLGSGGLPKTVALRFEDLDLERCGSSCCDFVRIHLGNTNRKMCASTYLHLNKTYYISVNTSQLTIEYHADGSVPSIGFKLHYETLSGQQDNNCSDCSVQCRGLPYVYDYFGCCLCNMTEPLPSVQPTTTYVPRWSSPCPTSVCPTYCPFGTTYYYSNGCYHCVCAGTTTPHYHQTTATYHKYYFSNTSGDIKSPNYPYSSPNSVQIFYEIDLGIGGISRTVALSFEDLDLERCGSSCCDFVRIHLGNTNRKMCTSTYLHLNKTYYIPVNTSQLTLEYHADSSVVSHGFKLHYETLSGRQDNNCTDCNVQCRGLPYVYDYFGCCLCNISEPLPSMQTTTTYVPRWSTTSWWHHTTPPRGMSKRELLWKLWGLGYDVKNLYREVQRRRIINDVKRSLNKEKRKL